MQDAMEGTTGYTKDSARPSDRLKAVLKFVEFVFRPVLAFALVRL